MVTPLYNSVTCLLQFYFYIFPHFKHHKIQNDYFDTERVKIVWVHNKYFHVQPNIPTFKTETVQASPTLSLYSSCIFSQIKLFKGLGLEQINMSILHNIQVRYYLFLYWKSLNVLCLHYTSFPYAVWFGGMSFIFIAMQI